MASSDHPAESMRASSLSDSPPPPPLPAKGSARVFPAHVVQGHLPQQRYRGGSFDVERPLPADFPHARRTASSFSAGQTGSGASSQATTRNNSITSAHSTASTIHGSQQQQQTSAPESMSPYGQHRQPVSAGPSPVPPFSFARGTPAPSIAPSTASTVLYNSQGYHPARASVSAYDAKAIFNSFDTLPPLPSIPTSQNPHPAPDPTGMNAQPFPHPSHPTSALSSLFLHVLPVFNGDPLRNPIESLNALVTSHITATFTRYSSPARVLSTLTTDLKDILGSGMLTLEAKLHAVGDDDRLVGRVVDVWVFFWTAVVPYIEGIFLPLILDPRIVEVTAVQKASGELVREGGQHAIDPRLHLLTLFLISLLHPHLPRILPLLAPPHPLPSPAQLARLQQMALILLTQSDPHVTGGPETVGDRTADAFAGGFAGVRDGLENLLRSVGQASRARAQAAGSSSAGGVPFANGLAPGGVVGGTPKKGADNRRGGWIAGKHRRGLSQAAASIPLDTGVASDGPVLPTSHTRDSLNSLNGGAGAGGTARAHEDSHLRASQTPRQANVFRGVMSTAGSSTTLGAATATPTYTMATTAGLSRRAAGGTAAYDAETDSEAGYLNSLRSPEPPWSGASSPTHSNGEGDELDDRFAARGWGTQRAAEGQVEGLGFDGAEGRRQPQQRSTTLDDRRHSSPPTVSDRWAGEALGQAL